jgi:Ca2+/H+ antiporter, TMEM165/GDT1 family
MGSLYSILKELLSLFVDDGYLALAVVAWVALMWLLSGQLLQHFYGSGLILFLGLGGLLVESARRRAARH